MPLIDMVFLLLIFFLVASTFAKEERQLDINLPTSSAAQPLSAPPKQLVVNIDEDGVITVNGQTYSPDGLVAMIRESVERDSNREIFIRRRSGEHPSALCQCGAHVSRRQHPGTQDRPT